MDKNIFKGLFSGLKEKAGGIAGRISLEKIGLKKIDLKKIDMKKVKKNFIWILLDLIFILILLV